MYMCNVQCACLSDDIIIEVDADLDVDDDIVVRFVYVSFFGYSP